MEWSNGHRRDGAWGRPAGDVMLKRRVVRDVRGRWRAAYGLILLVALGCTPVDGGGDVARLPDTHTALPTITTLPASVPGIAPSTTIQTSATPVTPVTSVTSVTPVTPTFVPTQPPPATLAEVIYGGEEGLHLRAAPNEAKIATFLKGSLLTLQGAPRDVGGFRWWPVGAAAGWVAERSSDTSQPPWLAPLEGGALEIGRPAQVVYGGGDGLNLRRAPGAGSEKIATLLKPSSVVVVDGPRTVAGVRWWLVQVGPGWIAEGALDASQPRWLRFAGS